MVDNRLTVGQLRQLLAKLPAEMRVGVYDQDDCLCEVQLAHVGSLATGEKVFHLRANGGVYLDRDCHEPSA